MARRSQSPARIAASVAVAVALVAGIWARFTPRSPLWLDEALTVNIARLPLGEIGDALLRDGHPPLYYWLLHGWMALAGEGDLAVRSLSGIIGVATIPLAWLLGRRVGGPRTGLVVAAVVTVSPYAIRYSSETRMYGLVMLLVVAGSLLLDDLHRRPGAARAVAVALVTGALLWTHYWALYLVGVVGLGLLLEAWRRPAARRRALWCAGALVGGGCLLLPWLPSLLEQAESTGTPWAIPARPTQVVQYTLGELGGGGFAEAAVAGALLTVLLVLAFVPVVGAPPPGVVDVEAPPGSLLRTDLLAVVSGATLAVGWAAAQLTAGAYAARYAAVVVPFVLVVAVVGLLRLRPVAAQVALGGAVLALFALGAVHNLGELRTQAGRHAAVLAASAGPDDVVVVCPDQLAPDLDRAMAQRRLEQRLVVYPHAGDPAFVDWRDYEERNRRNDPAAFVQALQAEHPDAVIWVVWQGGYRTLIEQCEAVVEGLADLRPGDVVARNTDAFEPSSLWRFDP